MRRAALCLVAALLLAPAARAGDDQVPPGQVLLNVKDADLCTEVLPRIAARAGVKFIYRAPARKVSLRLIEPVRWEDALDLVCRFARVHHSFDSASGKIVIHDRFGGKLGASDDFSDLNGKADGGTALALEDRLEQVDLARTREASDWNQYLRRSWDQWMQRTVAGYRNPLTVPGGFSWSGGTLQGSVPRGPQGPTGYVPRGQQGPTGQRGPTGVVPRGAQGPTGTVPRGQQGPTGNVLRGPQGPTGNVLRGPQGPTGNVLRGPQGPTGNVPRGPSTGATPASGR